MRNKKGISLVGIILIIFIIILAIALCAVVILKKLDKEDNKGKANYAQFKLQDSQLDENKIVEEDKNIDEIKKEEQKQQISTEYINKWVGTYENNNLSIAISKFDEKNMYVSISKVSNEGFSFSGKSFNVAVESESNQIVYEDEFMDDIDKVVITYTPSGINVQSSSTDADSLLNEISGNYIKKEAEKDEKELDWEGTYINGGATISITDTGTGSLNIVMKEGISNYNYTVQKDDENITKEKITYEDDFFDEIDNFIIEKTNEGIKVEASSTDADSLLNRISGEYSKK